MQRINKHIILIGFMGTGKTVVGSVLAKHLGRNYIDTDKEIELLEGTSINEIFLNKGEEYFRQVEMDVLNSRIDSNIPLVISTGGGIVLSEDNRIRMQDSLVILLQATPEVIYNRIKEDASRPLLNNGINLLTQISDLLEHREKIYKQTSNFIIDTDKKEVEEIVSEIVEYL